MTMASEDLTIQQQLHAAIESGDMDGVSRILTLHPVLINTPFNGNTPLTAAVMAHKMDIVRLLVEKGVKVTRNIFELSEEIADQDGLSDEDRITAHDISAYLEEHREVEAPLTEGELKQQRVLNAAINDGDVEKVREILARFPRLVNIEYNLHTPLSRAINMVDIDIVRALLEAGANVGSGELESGYIGVEDVDRMGGDTTTIQNIVELLENPPAVAPRAPDFGDEPAAPTLEVTDIEYKELPDVFDMTLNKDIPIFDALAKRRLIFTVDDSYYGISLGSIESSLKDKTSTFYECKKELDGSPYTQDVHMDTPYFRLTLNGNFTVTEKHLQSALASECSIFELVPNEKKLAFVSSYRIVQVSPGINGLGEDVNIMSADHCQKGSDQFTYDLKAVTMVKYRTAEQKEIDRVAAEKKAVEDAAVAERMKQEAIVRKKAQEEQAARVAARGSGRRRTYRKSAKGKKTNKRKTYRK